MQLSHYMVEPAGVGGEALLETVVNHLTSRDGPVHPAEMDMVFGIIASLHGRVSPESMDLATARLAELRTTEDFLPDEAEAPESMSMPPAIDTGFEQPATIAPVAQDLIAPNTGAQDVITQDLDAQDLDAQHEIIQHLIPEEPASLAVEAGMQPEPDHSPVMLSSACPEALAATCAPERLQALAQRPHPSERLCSLIVSRGHADALVAILRNPHARFAKSSLTTMVELAASDMSLREAMCARPDLTDMILDRLWPYLSQTSRAAVLAAGCASNHAEALVICADAASEEASEISDDETLRSVAEWSSAVRVRDESLSHAMRTLDQEGRIVDVAAMLAEFAGIETAMALSLMIGSYDRGAVALARLAGCDDDSMMSLIHLRGRAGARGTADKRGPLHAFAKMTEDEARSIILGCFSRLAQGNAALSGHALSGHDSPSMDARAAA
jgi:Uncharacterised protein conserved in bacteria (DUF2336)